MAIYLLSSLIFSTEGFLWCADSIIPKEKKSTYFQLREGILPHPLKTPLQSVCAPFIFLYLNELEHTTALTFVFLKTNKA